MLNQQIKSWTLFLSCLFTIMAISDYFGAGQAYAPLIATAFIIHLIGCVADLVLSWQIDRRKQDYGVDERDMSWLIKRIAD